MQDFLAAVALLLIFEGLFPFLDPDRWRRSAERMIALEDRLLRRIGLAGMCGGLLLLYLVRSP